MLCFHGLGFDVGLAKKLIPPLGANWSLGHKNLDL